MAISLDILRTRGLHSNVTIKREGAQRSQASNGITVRRPPQLTHVGVGLCVAAHRDKSVYTAIMPVQILVSTNASIRRRVLDHILRVLEYILAGATGSFEDQHAF